MIILDTHTWIWWVSDPQHLSQAASKEIATAKRIGVPAIECWEIATLVAKGRIALDRDPLDWIEQALALPRVELVPLTPAIAVRSTQLGPDFHGDPADRLIVATALLEAATLVTKDAKIRAHAAVRSVW